MYETSQIIMLYKKRLNKTESPIFILSCVLLCFQRQPFRLVYIIMGCGEEYIEERGNFLRESVTIHNQQICDPHTRMLKISEHIDKMESIQINGGKCAVKLFKDR